MSLRLFAVLAGLFLALAMTSAAEAYPGYATGTVNLRTGPGVNYSRILGIPGGSPVEIYDCSYGWCQVGYAGYTGWAIQTYLSSGPGYAPPPPPPPEYYPPYPYRPWRFHRHPGYFDPYGNGPASGGGPSY